MLLHVPSPTTLSPHHPTNMLHSPTPHILNTPQGYFHFSYLILLLLLLQVSNGILKIELLYFVFVWQLWKVGILCIHPPSFFYIYFFILFFYMCMILFYYFFYLCIYYYFFFSFEETAGSVAITVQLWIDEPAAADSRYPLLVSSWGAEDVLVSPSMPINNLILSACSLSQGRQIYLFKNLHFVFWVTRF